ncbi:AP-5 complex subunit zeta-1 [Octopus bimaculoides]|uniref:AP-5 complex subunit zeta-1 n=1 Tax=Octopus bimaculoides TaxID=37653 RepID=UPI00071DF56C|nr:AP-5 complex subunit zeta-1 [Octopus bimaculoides]|eukprot:XP_014770406.1 PREDICTED: AP-5 complex subunit zeta-1-like [Octopus bimaculoides]
MALAMVDAVLAQVRNTTAEDVQNICSSALISFSIPERHGQCMKLLRQLFLVLQNYNGKLCIPSKLLSNLFLSAVVVKKSNRECLLCKQIFIELLASDEDEDGNHMAEMFNNSVDVSRAIDSLPFYLVQGQKIGCLAKMVSEAVRWLSSGNAEIDKQRRAFTFIVAVVSLHSEIIKRDDIGEVNKFISTWLMEASRYQAPNPYTRNLFKKEKTTLVSEIDGTPSKNFFTVLNVAQYNTDDQFLNLYTFSMLYQWLKHTIPVVSSTSDELQSLTSSQGTSSISLSPALPKEFALLTSRVIDYCFRVLDQCERKPKIAADIDFQNACLIETVNILDAVCKVDKEQTPRIFTEMKRLFTNLTTDNNRTPRILVNLLQFYINHSSTMVHDPQSAYDLFFGQLLSQKYNQCHFVFDTVMFLRDNLETLCYKTNILSKYFPNIFKILAWNPPTFVKEFEDLLPAMITQSTALEVFHRLLELPCLTALLEASEKLKKGDVNSIEPDSSVQALQKSAYNPLFNFIMSPDSGHGDTINRLDELYEVLHDMRDHPRVINCAEVLPKLLSVYFSVILEDSSEEFTSCLVSVLLERVSLLYDVPGYKRNVRKLFADYIVKLLKLYPYIVIKQRGEIIDYLINTHNMKDDRFFMHLVWSVGEFCSCSLDNNCSAKIISKYYEVLETLMYEWSSTTLTLTTDEEFPPRLMSILMSATAKLASRCQDLIPRAVLCLGKVYSQLCTPNNLPRDTRNSLLSTAQEFINLFSFTNFASVILNPSSEIQNGRCHQDNMCFLLVDLQFLTHIFFFFTCGIVFPTSLTCDIVFLTSSICDGVFSMNAHDILCFRQVSLMVMSVCNLPPLNSMT